MPLVLFFNEIDNLSNKFIKYIIYIFFTISFIFSLIMGWLGVINMYKPALTGERRIWMDVYDLPKDFSKHSFKEYLDATFLNRKNFWIPIMFSLIFLLIYLSLKNLKIKKLFFQ